MVWAWLLRVRRASVLASSVDDGNVEGMAFASKAADPAAGALFICIDMRLDPGACVPTTKGGVPLNRFFVFSF